MIRRFLLRTLVNLLGLIAAAELLGSGIEYGAKLSVLVIAALIFSLVNAFIRPVIVLLSLPAIILTLGLFTFIVNAFMLYLVTLVYPHFQLHSFWAALAAAAIIWMVNYLLNGLMESKKHETTV